MSTANVATSTTDVIPAYAHRTVSRSMLIWAAGHDSMAAAHAALVKWVVDNGFDGVVGVRCEITANVHGTTRTHNLGTFADVQGQTASKFLYTMYGTAISYAD
ncbi:MAG: hypothetical protein ACTHMS_05960 [Jatrophihabitans sp.]|uniref:hypothetical protein n=1 Tax=Jatrophihabitans sp. TaxID=1932789 RepID=UPI003F7D2FF7